MKKRESREARFREGRRERINPFSESRQVTLKERQGKHTGGRATSVRTYACDVMFHHGGGVIDALSPLKTTTMKRMASHISQTDHSTATEGAAISLPVDVQRWP